MARSKTNDKAAILFNLFLALAVPVAVFTGAVIFVAYSHELSQLPGLEWFTPLEDYFQNAETPVPVAIVVLAFVLIYLATYAMSFPPRYPQRPIKRLLFLDLLVAGFSRSMSLRQSPSSTK